MAKRKKHKTNLLKWLFIGLLPLLIGWFLYSWFVPGPTQLTASPFFGIEQSVAPEFETKTSENEDYLPESTGELIRHTYYVLSFNSGHKQANWVYYRLSAENRTKESGRTDNFREDPLIGSGSAKPSDYTKSGYDRGHLCPAGDMTQSAEAMSETFYMSNMSPQVPAFNRGIWKRLEEQVRKWGIKEQIYVITGPVFKDVKGKIGNSRVTVPGFFYKVIYSPSRKQMIGFVLPNGKEKGRIPDYVVSVDSVERLTGIDFFPQLPDSLENRLESRSDYRYWE